MNDCVDRSDENVTVCANHDSQQRSSSAEDDETNRYTRSNKDWADFLFFLLRCHFTKLCDFDIELLLHP